jgi:pyochelin biosynthetic protein PchC
MRPEATEIQEEASAWFRSRYPVDVPRLRIICFPPASGSASFFREWTSFLPRELEVVATQYPGRGDRFDEPSVTSLHHLGDRIVAALPALLDVPYVLFGHSLGALVAYEVAVRLESMQARRPVKLVVSSCAAPSGKHIVRELSKVDDDEFLKGLQDMVGEAVAIPTDPELRSMILPAARADMMMAETYRPSTGVKLPIPVSVIVGDADPELDYAQACLWSEHTTSHFDIRTFPGGHFYLASQEKELLATIQDLLE